MTAIGNEVHWRRSGGAALTVARTFFFAAIWLLGAAAQAADFEAGNQLYDEGKFAEARQRYDQLVQTGQWSANLFYNLGNASYRLGTPGLAILNYERALALDPEHPEARSNLALLHRQTGARLWPDSWLDHAFPSPRVDLYVVACAVFAWLAVFCFALILLTPRREKSGLWLGAVTGALVAAYAGGAIWHFEQSRTLAIVTAAEVETRLAPADSAGPAGTLPAGSQVRVLSERGDWVYCALPGSGRGWIPAKALERVRLAPS